MRLKASQKQFIMDTFTLQTVKKSPRLRKEGCILPEYYASGRDPRRNSNSRSQSTRPQNTRYAGSRPPQKRRPAKRRRRRTQPRFFVILAVVIVALIAALVLILGHSGGQTDSVQPQATPEVSGNASGMSNATISSHDPDELEDASAAVEFTDADVEDYDDLSAILANEDADISALSEAGMVDVADLNINTSLPQEWMNVLLLGTDERTLTESPRTDTMIICSINTSTGEVKLTSIMRDTAVEYDDLDKYNGTYRINAANFFGGPEYAIKTVNELLDLNIQYYVSVNFFGFQRIAQALGGIDVDITEAEMNEINKKQVNQAKIAYAAGIDESDQENEYLETYGPNTHLNGRQTLAYARVRSVDSDFSRAERQRTVLIKLMEKLKGKNAIEIISLVNTFASEVKTNMALDKIAEIAVTVLNSGLSNVETFRIPMNGTYTEERRNEQAMLYDCDWTTNSRELYSFIYN